MCFMEIEKPGIEQAIDERWNGTAMDEKWPFLPIFRAQRSREPQIGVSRF